uniref:Retrovirus-related Pol polyprotein from transposon TNT 1-94 n=1 Tax=Tanacetum cinerariifolium TaxID=118510 RepID=A0A699GYW9_TANCI|nr:retrovirus-related Pol polyprotein from transposon TNT 1-94 [Tanacetum cinerariifolium]
MYKSFLKSIYNLDPDTMALVQAYVNLEAIWEPRDTLLKSFPNLTMRTKVAVEERVFLERQGEAQGRLRGARFLVIEDRGSSVMFFGFFLSTYKQEEGLYIQIFLAVQKDVIACKGLEKISMTKFDIEKCDGKNDFTLWHIRKKALLEQQGLAATLEELPATTIAAYDNVIQKKTFGALILCMGDRVLREINKETTTLVGDLAAIDTAISDDDHVLLLLTSLPSSYDNFVETLLYGNAVYEGQMPTKKCMKSRVTKHLGAAGIQQQNRLVEETNVIHWAKVRCILIQSGPFKLFLAEDTTMSTYLVNRSPSSANGFKIAIDMLKFFGWLASIRKGMLEPVKVARIFLGYHIGIVGNKLWMLDDVTSKVVLYRNMGYNESGEYKKTFTGSGVCTVLVKVLQGLSSRWNHERIMHLREDNNEVAFAVAEVEKIYAHESLTFNDTVTSTVVVKAVTTAKAITKSIHRYVHTSISLYRWYGISCGCKVEIRVTKGLLDRAKENVLGMEIFKDQSGNTLRVS